MRCLYCGKKTNRPKFCSNKHKDRYHNEHNPRGIYAHLKETKLNLEFDQIDDSHSCEEDCMGIHE